MRGWRALRRAETEAARLEDALASRPDRACGGDTSSKRRQKGRLQWERARVVTLLGILDAKWMRGRGVRTRTQHRCCDSPTSSHATKVGSVAPTRISYGRASDLFLWGAGKGASFRPRARHTARTGRRSTWREEMRGIARSGTASYFSAAQAGRDSALHAAGNQPASRRRPGLLDAEADLQRATIALKRTIGRSCAHRLGISTSVSFSLPRLARGSNPRLLPVTFVLRAGRA